MLKKNNSINFKRILKYSSCPPVQTQNGIQIQNEPILSYKPNSKERSDLKSALNEFSNKCEDIPIVIGDKELKSDAVQYQVMPHNHKHRIAKFYHATKSQIQEAIKISLRAKDKWKCTSSDEKFKIWMKAGDMMAGKYRQQLNASTMLGQSKTIIQAEIDAACELIDFIKFNAKYFMDLPSSFQPISPQPKISKNTYEYRPLDGFVASISPFNFTAIGGNLAYTPALMGNTVLWKPSDTAVLSNWIIFKIMREAGVPPGVVNFIPCQGELFGNEITASPHLGAINFTGSVPTFQKIWKLVGGNIKNYRCFPRMIGECGGKNFHFVHPSADETTVLTSTIRSAFEYCGQKCSACSRLYVPESMWANLKSKFFEETCKLKIDDVTDFTTFTSAVIDDKSFGRIRKIIDSIEGDDSLQLVCGGTYNDKCGYFIFPTIVQCKNADHPIITDEIFGPVLAVYVYKDDKIDETIKIVISSKYGLTGAVYAQDKNFLRTIRDKFKMAAGNLYINDKSTGSVVGQQPFGGGRLSGTNDKAGSPHYLLRWTSPQNIKETFVQLEDINYPYMVGK